jgi:DNA-binding NarL/FixJ family response regulator
VGCRVLIVEDDALQGEALDAILVENGFEVAGRAKSGPAALRLARAQRPDVVLMDVRLAGPWDGVDTAVRIRAEHACRVVFVTAQTDRAARARMDAQSPTAVLIKPVSPDEIVAAVERACSAAA